MRAKNRSRRRKLTAATLALLIVAGIALVAVSVTGTTGLIDCTATRVSQNLAEISMNNADAGATCTVLFQMVATGRDQDLRVQDLNFAAEVTEGFLGAMNVDGCRAPVPHEPAAPGSYSVRLTVPTDATPGAFSAQADAGFVAVDGASYVDANCPRA
jgi:hypothetical protein